MRNKTIEFNAKSIHEGSFSVQVFRHGKEILSLPRTKNLITRGGMDSIKEIGRRLHVGTGGDTPVFADTSLQTFLAASTTAPAWVSSTDVLNGTDYEKEVSTVITFAIGAVVGNIAELGLSNSASEVADLHTRALFKDGVGDPTTIAVTAIDQLVVTYFLKKTVTMVPVVSTISATIEGVPTDIDYTLSPCISTSGNAGSDASYASSIYLLSPSSDLYMTVNDAVRLSIAAVTYIPSFITTDGDAVESSNASVSLTAAGNEVIHTFVMPINDGNFEWICATFSLSASSIQIGNILFQIVFDGVNKITKANTDNVTFKFKEINNQVIA
jgi:hypothetical protein